MKIKKLQTLLLVMTVPLVHADDSEVFFERALTPEERQQRVVVTKNPVNANTDIRELRRRWKTNDWAKTWAFVKVELVYADGNDSNNYMRITTRDPALIREMDVGNWAVEARPRLTLGTNVPGFKQESVRMWWIDPPVFYAEGVPYVGYAEEILKDAKGRKVVALIYEVPDKPASLHEFLRRLMRDPLMVKKTPFGTVLRSPAGQRVAAHGGQWTWAAWMSRSNTFLYVDGEGIDPDDLVALYGPKLPSSLPRNFKVDKAEWGREHVRRSLDGMALALAGKSPSPGDGYQNHLNRLLEWVFVAGLDPYVSHHTGTNLAARPVLLADLERWWSTNRARAYWDEDARQLCVRGQNPKEHEAQVKKELKERAEREREAILSRPITAPEKAAIFEQVTPVFEKFHQETTADMVRMRGGRRGGDRVRWVKLGERQWLLEKPTSNLKDLVRIRYSGPRIEETKDRQRPFRAYFDSRWEDPTAIPPVLRFREFYDYDKLSGVWRRIDERMVKD